MGDACSEAKPVHARSARGVVTDGNPLGTCNLCGRQGSVTVEPPRRTVARGEDPDDPSLSVIAVLPDIVLCEEHADEVARGELELSWCDDDRCRLYGEVGTMSPCGESFTKFKK